MDNINLEKIKASIVEIRAQKVISDADVASLYGVETKRINEAVKNNIEKFPKSYMFQLTEGEFNPHYSSSGQIIFQIILKFHTYEISIDS